MIRDFLRHRESVFSHLFERVILCYPFEDRSLHTRTMIESYKSCYRHLEVRKQVAAV